MLKKENRIVSDFEFNVTRKHGKKVFGKYFTCWLLTPRNYSGPFKAGIVVPNKLINVAPKRNSLKRKYRELIRANPQFFNDNSWCVFHPKLEALEKTYEELSIDFIETLQKVSVTD
ncbi:hypothetical protein A3K34_03960 [candidate division WWE3 bacterium RIFOXYC1_FULL_40_10]|uniref:Ribonuclease P protein component n=1 Tax=candidate division WWE3 bacterium RIFOXYA2_FULL_46_9 TaxID=1802636 RepID=A0A1F4W1I9_UNCKA|nr:MAG: hypothetical protein A3K58_03960 [candidate division WWE3 bacterium RIFOXYB1_FULL_40_22]OGC61996.1 MAG: hypothetical protein A3K37_03960 [candidate division WWE3 bacterium RIFOXYA1_FULL_40_11]OGC62913.1 MAG: hypothetical protein A2264_03475 [candidate division WWE3 bacterium RIFOXYA2_FULL_46_9]OGC65061.1 MAG: hypothetical protein A2326_03420 [candidate division WWE3 bacterium RIFOXYB2_FULL_41_6]OGC66379.1 MAG: hypothetical protein A3K34_03960 [candidate division WWE3 bacterium RIFOXYC1_